MDSKTLAKTLAKKYWYLFILLTIVLMAFWIRSFPARYGELQALDPLYMFRISEYVLENDFRLPETDIMRAYPYGGHPFLADPPVPFYMPTVLYSILTMLGMNMIFFHFALITPAIFGALAVLAMFFLGKELFNNYKAGLFSAFFLATVPAFITRTSAGFYEKEPLAGFLLIFSIYFFVRAYKRNSILAGIISGISLALLGLTWGGVQFLYAFYAAFALILIILNRCPTRLVKSYIPTAVLGIYLTQFYPSHPHLFMGVVFFAQVVIVFVLLRFFVERFNLIRREQLHYFTPVVIVLAFVIIMGASMFIDPISNTVQNFMNAIFVSKGVAGQTVAEQMPGGWNDIAGPMGLGTGRATSLVPQLGSITNYLSIWGFTLIGIIMLLYSLYKTRKFILFIPLLWIIVAIYGVFGMIRLIFLLGPAAALVSGYFFSELIKHSSRFKTMENDSRIGWLLLITGAVFFLSFLSVFSQTILAAMLLVISIPFILFGYLLKEKRIEISTNLLIVPLSVFIALTLIVNTSTGYVHGMGLGPSICFPQSSDYVCVKYNEDGTYELAQDQPWYQAMDYFAKETPENSSILSWWDFGYWFQMRGQRPSVSDGGGVGPRKTIADWFVDSPENWNNHLDILLKKHNVTHILMDYTLPGKYGAISKIAYEGEAVYGYMEFPRQPSQIYPEENRTIYEFSNGPYVLWIPLDDSGNLVDTPMLLQSQGGQFVSKIYINDMCTTSGIMHTGDREPSVPGCISITPYKVYYVPQEIEFTIFNSLMLMDGYGLPVNKVFDNYLIRIYEVEYPDEQPETPETEPLGNETQGNPFAE